MKKKLFAEIPLSSQCSLVLGKRLASFQVEKVFCTNILQKVGKTYGYTNEILPLSGQSLLFLTFQVCL
jgi:hypothetical protein